MFDLIPFRRNQLTRPGEHFSQFLENLFDEDFFSPLVSARTAFRVDLKETDDAYVVEADLPGVKKEDIKIGLQKNYLIITAQRNEVTEEKQENYVRQERRHGQLQRSFYVTNINEDKVSAEYKDGVLKITLPKKTKTEEFTKTIDIK